MTPEVQRILIEALKLGHAYVETAADDCDEAKLDLEKIESALMLVGEKP